MTCIKILVSDNSRVGYVTELNGIKKMILTLLNVHTLKFYHFQFGPIQAKLGTGIGFYVPILNFNFKIQYQVHFERKQTFPFIFDNFQQSSF